MTVLESVATLLLIIFFASMLAVLISMYRADWKLRVAEARRQIANDDRALRSEERQTKIAEDITRSVDELIKLTFHIMQQGNKQQEHFEDSVQHFERLHKGQQEIKQTVSGEHKKTRSTVEQGLGKRGLGR